MRNFVNRRFRQDADRERGDTLIEVIIAIGITAAAAAALIGTILTSITSSGEHRTLSVNDTLLKSYSAAVENALERGGGYRDDCTYSVTKPAGIPAGYDVNITKVQSWNGTAFGNCAPGNTVQLITITATSPTQLSNALTFAVRNPA